MFLTVRGTSNNWFNVLEGFLIFTEFHQLLNDQDDAQKDKTSVCYRWKIISH